jgi:hypothetical protein
VKLVEWLDAARPQTLNAMAGFSFVMPGQKREARLRAY